MTKKAQITFFIVIGLVLLIGASIVIYLASQKEEARVEEILYPPDILPVINFITECTRQAGVEALQILGQQGGYIAIPALIANDAGKYLALDAEGIRKVPFWFFEGKTVIPSLNFMENQIEDFVQAKLGMCFNGFRDFKQQFDITPLGDLKVKTKIAEANVIIELTYPLKIKSRDSLREHLAERFVVGFPVKLKKMHDLASQILFAENEQGFLENLTLSLMIDNNKIPMDGMTLDCQPRKWYLADIKAELQDMLKFAVPSIRIRNTVYPEFIESEAFYERLANVKEKLERDQREGSLACYIGKEPCKKLEESKYYPSYVPADAWEYTHLFYDVNAEPANLKVSFQYYPEMGLEILADPSRNGVLSTSLMKGPRKFLSMICLNAYHFVYTVRYPVKIAVRDDLAFDGRGFMFEYALPVLISDNLAARKNYGIMSIPSFEPEEFCGSLGLDYFDIQAEGYLAEDLPPGDIDDALITYNCGNKYCVLGKTSALGGEYKLRTRLPEGCNAPFIEAEKDGYLKAGAFLTGQTLAIPLKKLARLNYEIVKHPYTEADQALHAEQKLGLDKDDKVMVYLRLADEDYDQFKEYPCTECTIDFLDSSAKYDIDIFLQRGGKIIGGYSAKDILIGHTEIGGRQTVVFHTYEYIPFPDTNERQMKQIEYFSSQSYANILRPEFR